MDDIEHHVNNAASQYVTDGTKNLKTARHTRRAAAGGCALQS